MEIAIIGGGAAGFMAAITAAEANPAAQITIYEKQPKVLGKVRISGGGRCNVTHNEPDVALFARQYPRGQHFLRKLMLQFGQPETIAWFEQRGVRLRAEPDGRMFPVSNSSQTVINCLCETASRLGVRVVTGVGLVAFGKLNPDAPASPFTLRLSDKSVVQVDRLLIATGGKPKVADYQWIEGEHEVVQPVPSLFTFNAPGHFLLPLMGVAVPDARVRVVEAKEDWRGPVLITHWGFSGPAVLKLSAICARELADITYWFTVLINWIPDYHEQSCRDTLMALKTTHARKSVQSYNPFGLPSRLWVALCQQVMLLPEVNWADASKTSINELTQLLIACRVDVRGKTTFKEEFVTAGGIALTEINSKTLESKRMPGLYFAGEVLNVDGITGGFNFQNAWTTGYVAGLSLVAQQV
jgi:predicted Rossmann fold flavoprotein